MTATSSHTGSDATSWPSRRAWLFSIRARIFLSLALLATVLLLVLAMATERQAREMLEGELTLKLQAVGWSALSLVGPGVVPALLGLTSAHEGFGFYQDRRAALIQLRDRTGVRRIFLADTTGRSFVDSDLRVSIGALMPQLRSDRVEMRRLREGWPAAAALFIDEQGQVRKTGYVPVILGGKTIGLVGVEGDATFLRAVRSLRSRILGIGLMGIVVAFLLAAPVARGLTRPLERLVGWARRLGSGDLSHPVPVEGRDEIAFLGHTLEQMRGHLESRDREQRAMVAGVAHEIRNPLSGIRLYTELLARDAMLGEAPRERLGKILKELDQLGRIVEEFLLYARPANPSPEAVSLAEVIPELLEWIRPDAARRGVRLEAARGEWPAVRFDPVHLRQVLRNLIQNAVDATADQGLVQICVERMGELVRLTVEDEGIGIEAGVRDRIFEPFFTTKAAGVGLGLAIVRRLSLLNDATVELSSPTGGGTVAVLEMPEA